MCCCLGYLPLHLSLHDSRTQLSLKLTDLSQTDTNIPGGVALITYGYTLDIDRHDTILHMGALLCSK